MERLGYGDHAKKSARCPFPGHDDQNPSFGIFQKDGEWYFKCHSRCGSGDVIDFIAKLKGIIKAEAIRELRLIAGVPTPSCLHNSGVSPHGNCVDVDTPKSPAATPAPYTPPPLELIPQELQDYICAAAESLNVDAGYILLPLLSSLGSAIGNARSILLKRGFVQPPVIWTGIIGRSGSRKSPALDAGCFAVIEHERELVRQNNAAMELFEQEMAEWESKSRKQRGVKPAMPVSLTCLMDNLTVEALADAMQGNPRGVLVKKDELSHWFASFDQYTNAKGADVSQWLSLHTGVFFGLDRRSDDRRYRIHQPRVALTGGIQPQVLKRVLTEDFFERGLPARFLFAYPPFQRDRWSEAEISEALHNVASTLFEELWLLQPAQDEHSQVSPKLLQPSEDAKTVFIEYYNECGAASAQYDEREEAAWNKLSGYAARLALVGQLARDPHAEIVTGEVMQAACDLARWFGNEAVRIYATLRETKEQREQRKLVEFIQSRGGVVTARDLMQSFRPLKNERDNAETALNALASAGIGKWEESQHTGAGRPGRKFRLSTVSTSTQFDESRGKMDNSVDVDSPNNQKMPTDERFEAEYQQFLSEIGEPDSEAEREWFRRFKESRMLYPGGWLRLYPDEAYPHWRSAREQAVCKGCEICGECVADEPYLWFHGLRLVARCPNCQEADWWADGYEIDEFGSPSCWNHEHTREQRIAERDLAMLEKATKQWKESAEGRALLETARRECHRLGVRELITA
jgi:hypothetical protein